jgi:single-strand DNA-binding protein
MKKIIITGNLGKEPEKRADQQGNDFATFSVGVAVGTKDKPKTDWVECTCNSKIADTVMQFLQKGSKVLVEGFPSVNAYMNKDNQAVGTLRVYVNNVEFLSPKNETNTQHDTTSANQYANGTGRTVEPMQGDNIPF